MDWEYGVTTVPERYSKLLPQSLKSLARAGFNRPRLFVDRCDSPLIYAGKFGLPVTSRWPPVKVACNWFLSLWELFLRNPHADRYAIFQDDILTYPNLRDYLDSCRYPDRGYWNLYTFPENERLAPERFTGWYQSNQKGRGALGLVFDNETTRILLSHRRMADRLGGEERKRYASIDGAVVETFRKEGIREYVHTPSLLQHTGLNSTVGMRKHPLAESFRGEEFDARQLIKSGKNKPRTLRIGLVGYNCASGLGEKNRQMATYLDIDRWLVKPHPKFKTLAPHPDVDTVTCPRGNERKLEEFVQSVDVLLFDETPYYSKLVPLAKKHNKRIVCVPAMEWLPRGGWTSQVDLFICPTRQCYDMFHHELPCIPYPWPVDTERFKFVERKRCESFLFLNGRGGWGGRKGAKFIKEAKELWPEMPLIVRSQVPETWPRGTRILDKTQSNADLYDEGDVLISPHTIDGTGLEPMEAMACGMPVITTDGKPWNEIPALARIPARVERRYIKRMVDWYVPSPEEIVEIAKRLMGETILVYSQEARAWAESRAWSDRAEELNGIIREGVAR